jgi:hypothetical protein
VSDVASGRGERRKRAVSSKFNGRFNGGNEYLDLIIMDAAELFGSAKVGVSPGR